jgi:hypothetical protein
MLSLLLNPQPCSALLCFFLLLPAAVLCSPLPLPLPFNPKPQWDHLDLSQPITADHFMEVSVVMCLPTCLPASPPTCLPACPPACRSGCLSFAKILYFTTILQLPLILH